MATHSPHRDSGHCNSGCCDYHLRDNNNSPPAALTIDPAASMQNGEYASQLGASQGEELIGRYVPYYQPITDQTDAPPIRQDATQPVNHLPFAQPDHYPGYQDQTKADLWYDGIASVGQQAGASPFNAAFRYDGAYNMSTAGFDAGLGNFQMHPFEITNNIVGGFMPANHHVQPLMPALNGAQLLPAPNPITAPTRQPAAGPAAQDRIHCFHDGCRASFGRASEFHRHLGSRHGRARYQCVLVDCFMQFDRKDKLRNHLKRGHRKDGKIFILN